MAEIIDTIDGFAFMQLAARKGALKLECMGMKRHGQSAYSICKQVYGLKGNKASVLRQMEELVDAAIEAKRKHES